MVARYLKAVFLNSIRHFIVYYIVNHSSACEVLIINNVPMLYT